MARVRKILREPGQLKNYYIIDACFLANKYIPVVRAPNSLDKSRIEKCAKWWREIDSQITNTKARIYIPDICIAEAFKTLAKKYYEQHWFISPADLNNARIRLRRDITLSAQVLRSATRNIKIHDISTNRDIILAVDRFYEGFLKYKKRVSLPDLIVLATAKYLMDFYDIPKTNMHIVTMDKALWEGSKIIKDLPHVYDPTQSSDSAERVFI